MIMLTIGNEAVGDEHARCAADYCSCRGELTPIEAGEF
jgi:hypothetical protein